MNNIYQNRNNQILTADQDSRLELKYRISYFQYMQIRNALYPYMRQDTFTRAAPGKGYLVKSLYFDTYDYQAYHEKMDGNSVRTKLRLRTYHDTLREESVIRAELKMRQAERVVKKSAFISRDLYRCFVTGWHWQVTADPVLIEFERLVHLKTLRPQVMVEYSREGYETRSRHDLRVTFDHKVRSAHSGDLFADHYFFREHNPHSVVMEIKFRESLPAWIRPVIHQYGLKTIANSKFTQAVQAARHNLYHPGHVVVIR